MRLWKKLFTGKEWQTEKWALTAMLTGFILTTGAHYYSQQNIADAAAANEQINEQYRILAELRAVESHVLAMESNLRSFLLTEDRKFLRESDRQMMQAQQQMAKLEAILAASQNEHFPDLQKTFRKKIDSSNKLLEVFSAGDQEKATALLNTSEKTDFTEVMQNTINALFGAAGGTALNSRRQATQAPHRRALFIDNLAYLLGVSLLVFAVIYLLYGLRKHMRLQDHLIEAKEAVDKSSQIKEQFLANMSHEIRTPLQAILGYTNLLGKEKLTEKQSQYVHHVQTAGENLLHIVTDILDVSRIESGMVRLENVPFSLSDLLHAVDSLFLPKARKKNIYLRLHPYPGIPDLLVGDPVRLTQTLVNLIDNAIKFTAEGGVDIIPDVVEQTPARLRLKITVQDTGIGIGPDQLPVIFERFKQADSQVTRMYGGSGLGLFIVKELVEQQKGRIFVESEPGRGSTFSFEIPYEVTDESSARRKVDPGRIELNHNFGAASILLVEDNLLNQRVVGTFLAEQGMDYDIADNGKAAIQRLEQKRYDLVLMDVQMPEMDGYSATEYIRDNMGLRIPIIAMTAHAFAGEREKALSHGMSDYIAKPIQAEDLFRLIARFVPLIRSRTPLSAADESSISLPPTTPGKGLSIDYNFLLASSRGKKGYLRRILELFLRQAPQEMDDIEQALRRSQPETVGRLAHGMKSTMGYVGLGPSFQPLLEHLEQQAQNNGTPDELQVLVERLQQLLAEAITKVKTEVMPLVTEQEDR